MLSDRLWQQQYGGEEDPVLVLGVEHKSEVEIKPLHFDPVCLKYEIDSTYSLGCEDSQARVLSSLFPSQLFRLRPSSLVAKGTCQIGHGGQGVRIRPEDCLPCFHHLPGCEDAHCLRCFHHLHIQHFRLYPSPLIPVGICQVGHADQGVRVLRPEHCLA